MDSSALIFVALAVAWAVYLIPKALEHHEDSARSRTIERFSHTMRVLARREPVGRRRSRLVATKAATAHKIAGPDAKPDQPKTKTEKTRPAQATAYDAEPAPLTPAQVRARRLAAAKAAKRRLRVVSLILVANATVAVLAGLQVFLWHWTAIPVGVLVAWLVACRLMVRRELAKVPTRRIPAEAGDVPDQRDSTEEIAVVTAADPPAGTGSDPDGWDPVPVTLPTYVSKPVARRSVRTIDLDSTGVWTSGHSEADSALVREADEAARAAGGDNAEKNRAVGS